MKVDTKDLSEVAFYQEGPGVRTSQFSESGVKLINVTNISNGKLDLSKTKTHISKDEAFGKYKHFLLEANDIVMASSGATWGKTTIVNKKDLPLCMNTSVIRFRPLNEKILTKEYLKIVLDSIDFKKQIKKLITGAAQPNFGPTHLGKIKVALPSLSDQIQIANILIKAETLIEQRKQSILLLDEFLKSSFLEMFGDPVNNEKKWETKTIEQLVKKEKYSLKRGPFGGALKKEIFVPSGYLVYEQFHALNNDFSFARYFIDENKFQELKAFEVSAGDIIISCSGVYLGKLAILPKGAKRGIINQALLKISLDEKIINNQFFIFLFSHPSFKTKFYGNIIGTGIPNFPSMADFKKFNFIYPSIELQNQFANIVSKTEALKEKYKNSLVELENLYGSLSQRAFKGELEFLNTEEEYRIAAATAVAYKRKL